MKTYGSGYCDPKEYPIIPQGNYHHRSAFLLNGGSSDTTVDGSVTPVDFTFIPINGSLVYSLELTMVALNASSVFDYGSLPILNNGSQIVILRNAVEEVYFNLRNMADFTHISVPALGSFNLQGNTTEDTVTAHISFENPEKCDGTTSFTFRVRDNLTGLLYQEINCLYEVDP
jgi:hypothetical protein